MKKLFTILTFILLVISCKKDNDEDKFLSFITAGQTDGLGIKYVDIVPDEKMQWGYTIRNLDLNNDSIDDFKLIYVDWALMSSTYENYLNITPLGENSVCVSKINTDWVESLAYKDTIGSNNNWSNSKASLFNYYWNSHPSPPDGTAIINEGSSGYWYDHDNIYMGVKIVKDSKQIFGWIDIKRNGMGKFDPKVAIYQYAITIPY